MVDEDLKLMADEAEKAIKERDAVIQDVVSKVGNVFFDVSKAGIKWTYEYRSGYSRGEGTATGRRAKFGYKNRGLVTQELAVDVSPQDKGNFYPYQMRLAEFIDAVGGIDEFNKMLVAGIKAATEGAKNTLDEVGSPTAAPSDLGKPRSLGDGALKFLKKT
ncbi:MAG: hypothetical protein M0Z68_02450 [Gammaproteobacteria bacterium]|nr:hypothetical protein [Gammaproteobacteria bacterium]